MTDVYMIRNQNQKYLTRQGEWADGSDNHTLFRTPHKDDAINMKVELSVRDPQLRLTIIPGAVDTRGALALVDDNSTTSAIDQDTPASFSPEENPNPELNADHVNGLTE